MDLEPRNILWNEEIGKVMIIDFERAKLVKARAVLGDISANRKRKRWHNVSMAKQGKDEKSAFTCERRQVAAELQTLV